MDKTSPCPNCESRDLYKSDDILSGGGYAPDLLPGLGGFWVPGKFNLVTCKDCGYTRFFARPEARAKLADSKKWKHL